MGAQSLADLTVVSNSCAEHEIAHGGAICIETRQFASYGTQGDRGLRTRTLMLLGAHAKLHEELDWDVFQWQSGRHRAVVLRPKLRTSAMVIGPLLRGRLEYLHELIVPSKSFFVVFELLVSSDETFFPQVSVMPNFDPKRNGVVSLGCLNAIALASLSQKAQLVFIEYARYGRVGCNCQHFVQDLAADLGLRAEPTEDEVALRQVVEAGAAAAIVMMSGSSVPITMVGTAAAVGVASVVSGKVGAAEGPVAGAAGAVEGALVGAAAVGCLVSGWGLAGLPIAMIGMKPAIFIITALSWIFTGAAVGGCTVGAYGGIRLAHRRSHPCNNWNDSAQ